MSKVSLLLLQVFMTYRCLHLTPLKEKKHPEEFYSVFGILSSALVSQKMCTKHMPDLESGRGIQTVISLEYQFGKL